ncbi:MAG: hypothetical protein GY696_06775 [Gammaproteobacteria bacterium]|nr:hypothetical protein [Gammaproteobacteria bacterium]
MDHTVDLVEDNAHSALTAITEVMQISSLYHYIDSFRLLKFIRPFAAPDCYQYAGNDPVLGRKLFTGCALALGT